MDRCLTDSTLSTKEKLPIKEDLDHLNTRSNMKELEIVAASFDIKIHAFLSLSLHMFISYYSNWAFY